MSADINEIGAYLLEFALICELFLRYFDPVFVDTLRYDFDHLDLPVVKNYIDFAVPFQFLVSSEHLHFAFELDVLDPFIFDQIID
jgi:hypothetical protein